MLEGSHVPVKAGQAAQMAPVHVLAVDDDPSVRQMITDYLGDHDMRVTALGSGCAIDDVMARDTIDLAVPLSAFSPASRFR